LVAAYPVVFFVVMGALFAAAGVVLGALGAHGLESRLDPASLDYWNTAVLYQLVHALALVATGILARLEVARLWVGICGWCFVAGILMFCGALYALALGLPRGVASFAPLGGAAFVVGWVAMLVGALRWR
jgi:uncharacterized membrane protein YgdD (TMEM256/DUF423 family)